MSAGLAFGGWSVMTAALVWRVKFYLLKWLRWLFKLM